jgi:hypothetical protein
VAGAFHSRTRENKIAAANKAKTSRRSLEIPVMLQFYSIESSIDAERGDCIPFRPKQ